MASADVWLSETPSGQAQGTFARREKFKNLRPAQSRALARRRPGRRRHLGDTLGGLLGGVFGSSCSCHRHWSSCCQKRCLCAPCAALGMETFVSPVRNFHAPGSGVRRQVRGPKAPRGRQWQWPRPRELRAAGAARPESPRQRARVGPGTPGQARGPGAWLSTCLSLVLDGAGWGAAAVNCELRLHGKRGMRGETQSYFKRKSQAIGQSGHLRNLNELQPPPTPQNVTLYICAHGFACQTFLYKFISCPAPPLARIQPQDF